MLLQTSERIRITDLFHQEIGIRNRKLTEGGCGCVERRVITEPLTSRR